MKIIYISAAEFNIAVPFNNIVYYIVCYIWVCILKCCIWRLLYFEVLELLPLKDLSHMWPDDIFFSGKLATAKTACQGVYQTAVRGREESNGQRLTRNDNLGPRCTSGRKSPEQLYAWLGLFSSLLCVFCNPFLPNKLKF